MLEDKKLYEIFKAKDTRFDGRFFVGITSTGIYCRPICRARQPKIENCTFFMSAAEAEQANFRPCLLCRPELAPGNSIADASKSLAKRATYLLQTNCGQDVNLEELAGELGCSDRHLRRIFQIEYGVSPIQYLQTCRLLLAKNLLTDTSFSILDVALAAGFGSLRRFNDLFKKRYNMTPSVLRKGKKVMHEENRSFTVTASYRPPFNWSQMLNFLAERAVPGVEVVMNEEYYRTVQIINYRKENLTGWIKVRHLDSNNALRITVSEGLISVLPQILGKVRHLFDLDCDPYTIFEGLSSMNEIEKEICVLGTRLPGCFDAYEMAVRAVLGQQITIKAATTLAGRLVEKFGQRLTTDIEGLNFIFPKPEQILGLEGSIENLLGPLGIISSRAKTIKQLAQGFMEGNLNLKPSGNIEEAQQKLLDISGIGPWTAQYITMRSMGWTDAFLKTDAAIKKLLAPYSKLEIEQWEKQWHPWGSYATISLWNSLHKEE